MKKYSIGLQLYSVRSDLYRDFEGTLKKVAGMGYDSVEFAGLYGKSAAEVKTLCQKYGLDPVSAHVGLSEMLADPDGVFETYKEIGCRYIAVPYLPAEDRPLTPNYGNVVASIAALTKKAKAYGLQMLYHNHDFEFVRLPSGEYGYDDLFSRIPDLGAEIDVCWVNVAGEDPAAYLKKYAARIPVVHFKDFVMPGKKAKNLYALIGQEEPQDKASEEDFQYRPLGCGAQDLPALIAALEGSVCGYVIVEQDEPSMGKTRLECAEISRNNLRPLGL